MFKQTLLTLTLACISIVAFAGIDYDLQALQEKYKNEHAMYLSETEHVTIKTKGNEYEIYSDVNSEMLFLTDKAKPYGKREVSFSKFSEISKLKAFAYLPVKGNPNKLKKERVIDFRTEDVYDGSFFFHDSKQIAFNFPGSEPGTRLSLKYRRTIKNPKFMGSNFFVSYLPTLNSKYSVTFPSNVDVKFKLFNTENTEVIHSKVVKGKNTTLTWQVKNQDPYDIVGGAPSLRHYAPHIVAYIGEIRLKDSTVTVLPNLDGLYNWYYTLIKDVNAEEDSSLKAITAEITNGIESKDEKARTIFNWVQDNIKYVAFEDGMGGFIPRPASKVCRNRYGDCKDMSSIITEMMKYAGIEANITWIGSDELPYDYTEIATPVVDNHMIASYRNEKNEVVILDAVGTYTPYGYPTEFIQGKQALISKGENNYEVYRVPVVPKEMNAETDFLNMTLNLADDKLSGNGKITAKGYPKFNYVYRLSNMTDPEERRDFIESYLEKGNNKFKIDQSAFFGLKDRDTLLAINYRFTLEDYCKTVGDETFINLNLDKDFSGSKLDIDERKGIALKFDHKIDDTKTVELTLPKNTSVSYVPKNVDINNDYFGFSIKYEQIGNKIVMTKNLYINTLLVEKESFEDWNNMIKQLTKAYKEVVIIKKK